MSDKFIVSWSDLQRDTRKLARKLLPATQWKGIIAVSRGGLVPSAILARELELRHVDTVCISSYDHNHQRDMTVLKSAPGDGEGFIIIDDLVDSGETAKKVRAMYPKATFVTVYAKPMGEHLVDEFIVPISQDTWIELPWDMTFDFVEPICKQG